MTNQTTTAEAAAAAAGKRSIPQKPIIQSHGKTD